MNSQSVNNYMLLINSVLPLITSIQTVKLKKLNKNKNYFFVSLLSVVRAKPVWVTPNPRIFHYFLPFRPVTRSPGEDLGKGEWYPMKLAVS